MFSCVIEMGILQLQINIGKNSRKVSDILRMVIKSEIIIVYFFVSIESRAHLAIFLLRRSPHKKTVLCIAPSGIEQLRYY